MWTKNMNQKFEPAAPECVALCCSPLYKGGQDPSCVLYLIYHMYHICTIYGLYIRFTGSKFQKYGFVFITWCLHVVPQWMAGLFQSCRPLKRKMHFLQLVPPFLRTEVKTRCLANEPEPQKYNFLMSFLVPLWMAVLYQSYRPLRRKMHFIQLFLPF